MIGAIRREFRRIIEAARTLDRQTVFVLTAAALLVILHHTYGDRQLFRRELAQHFPRNWQGLAGWGWWFASQGVFGFVVPVLCLLLFFKRKPSEIGLGLGDWKFALAIAGLYLPLVFVGTWIASDGASFQAKYPLYRPVVANWKFFVTYELLFLFYWIGWEYLWRGFVLFGTKHTLGLYAIFIQMVPFAIRHVNKPLAEGILSVFGGVAIGAVVWRCRSFWIAVPIHAAQMLCLDFWCTMRQRTGVSGTGLDDFWKLF
ncbi:MAG: CPBP family glutamic-type intramembrane protease [Planctomycetota bacterium]|jgi:hypothetical protein